MAIMRRCNSEMRDGQTIGQTQLIPDDRSDMMSTWLTMLYVHQSALYIASQSI